MRKQIGVALALGALLVIALLLGLSALQPEVQAAPAERPLAQPTRAVLSVTVLSRSPGTTVTLTGAVTTGHRFDNDYMTFLMIQNDYTETITATFDIPVTVDGMEVSDLEVPVAAGIQKMIGPFPTDTYNQGGSGADRYRVYVDYSKTTSVTVGAYRLK
jgi:hypothetical protein